MKSRDEDIILYAFWKDERGRGVPRPIHVSDALKMRDNARNARLRTPPEICEVPQFVSWLGERRIARRGGGGRRDHFCLPRKSSDGSGGGRGGGGGGKETVAHFLCIEHLRQYGWLIARPVEGWFVARLVDTRCDSALPVDPDKHRPDVSGRIAECPTHPGLLHAIVYVEIHVQNAVGDDKTGKRRRALQSFTDGPVIEVHVPEDIWKKQRDGREAEIPGDIYQLLMHLVPPPARAKWIRGVPSMPGTDVPYETSQNLSAYRRREHRIYELLRMLRALGRRSDLKMSELDLRWIAAARASSDTGLLDQLRAFTPAQLDQFAKRIEMLIR